MRGTLFGSHLRSTRSGRIGKKKPPRFKKMLRKLRKRKLRLKQFKKTMVKKEKPPPEAAKIEEEPQKPILHFMQAPRLVHSRQDIFKREILNEIQDEDQKTKMGTVSLLQNALSGGSPQMTFEELWNIKPKKEKPKKEQPG